MHAQSRPHPAHALRPLAIAYGALCYAVFLATFLYAVGFVMGLVVPKHIDSGPAAPFATALAIDLALLGLFAVQHSGMARPGFKRWWTRFVPAPVEPPRRQPPGHVQAIRSLRDREQPAPAGPAAGRPEAALTWPTGLGSSRSTPGR